MLIVIGEIPEGTCYPPELQDLVELLAPVLDAGGGAGGASKTLYIQASQPTGVPEETMWFEPVSRILKFYGKAPGDLVATWMLQTFPAGSITGDLIANMTITSANLSPDVQAQLNAVAASSASAVLALQEQTGACSTQANFFIMSDGTLRATGLNATKKNGTGFVSGADTSVLPKRCGFQPPLSTDRVLKVYPTPAATFVLTEDGNVYAAGLAGSGQLGIGGTSDKAVFQNIDGSYFENSPVLQLAVGSGEGNFITCHALTAAGKVFSWGHNYYGQLGQGGSVAGGTPAADTPSVIAALGTDNAEIVSAGAGTGDNNTAKVACYVRKIGGTVYGCGWNGDGNLGDATTVSKSTFVQVGTLTGITHIAAAGDGGHITFYAAKLNGADGSVYACGFSNKGQVGDGTLTSRSTPLLVLGPLSGISVSQINAFSCTTTAPVVHTSVFVRLSDGTLRAWGANGSKQLGLGSGAGTANVTSPAAPTVADLGATVLFVADVAIGGSNGLISAAVLTRVTGFDALVPRYEVYACGNNDAGNLGQGNVVELSDFKRVLLDTTDISEMGFGASNSGGATVNTCNLLIRLNNGAALGCGYDATGQLGVDASPASIAVPAYVNF